MIKKILQNKKQFLDLLLLADEQESMIDAYLERGDMYALFVEEALTAICVVTDEKKGVLEIKNIATIPNSQKKGFGKTLIEYIERQYSKTHCVLIVGTGDSPLTIPFYKKCGFIETHRLKNYFPEHYDHPIIEEGVQLIDKVYFEKKLNK